MADPSPEGSFRLFVEKRLGGRFQGPKIKGFMGVCLGLTADEAVESWILATRMHLLDDPESPDDALPVIAKDRRLERYYTETAAQHRRRLIDAWTIYKPGGAEVSTIDQLDAAGFGPANKEGIWGDSDELWGEAGDMWGDRSVSIDPMRYDRGPRGESPPYPSHYRVVFAEDALPPITPARPWGEPWWGQPGGNGSGIWGPTGLTDELYRLLLSIARKWKPPTHVLRGFRILTTGTLWGRPFGEIWGEDGGIWGGSIDIPIPI
jgi:hypothetical protein